MNSGNTPPGFDPGDRSRKPEDEIESEAAEWLALREERALTPAEEAAFDAWLAGDERRAAAVAELEFAWRTFDRLNQYPRADGQPVDPDFFSRPKAFAQTPAASSQSAQGDGCDTGGEAPLLLSPFWLKAFRTWAPLAAAAAIVVAAGLWFALAKPSSGGRAFAAADASSRILHLPDGTRVELRPGSEVDEQFDAVERRVRLLRGEAHFDVVKENDRAFIVETNGVVARALGTAFNVRLDAASVEILVTKGIVAVTRLVLDRLDSDDGAATSPFPAEGARQSAASMTHRGGVGDAGAASGAFSASDSRGEPAAAIVLEERQRAVISTIDEGLVSTSVVEELPLPAIDRILAWQAGRLVFEATPLHEVVARFNHYATEYHQTRLVLRDSDLGALRISGRFRSDNAETFAELLAESFGVAIERRDDEIYLGRTRSD